jgi:2-methylcitrate dehydratase PrpD
VWSAVATCALERELAFGEAVAAAAFGYELMVRLAEAAGPAHRQRWHMTTTAGTVSAAGAAARALGGDADVTADAVAHAASVAGGAAHALVERTATRFLHRAHAVETGFACARVACVGKPGGRRILADGRGTFVLADIEPLAAPRTTTALEETGFRLHAATGYAHAALDATHALGQLDAVEQVHVSVSPFAASIASNPHPKNEDETWWSIEHAVATALGVRTDSVDVRPTEEGWAATVQVRLRDGSLRAASVTEPRGHPDRPASDGDLRAKWTRLTGDDGAEPFERLVATGDADSFTSLVRELVATPR